MIILCFGILINQNSFAENNSSITSAQITKKTLSAFSNCVHYKIKGVCFWSSKTGITTTSYVEHYLPDLVITVLNKAGDNPWVEANEILDPPSSEIQKNIVSSLTGLDSGSGQHNLSDQHEQNVFYKEADVMGNPALTMLPDNGYILLPSTATPFKSYYQSMLDAVMWKGLPQFTPAIIEEGYGLGANIVHHVGTGLINWGSIYLHEGKIATSNDAKAASMTFHLNALADENYTFNAIVQNDKITDSIIDSHGQQVSNKISSSYLPEGSKIVDVPELPR